MRPNVPTRNIILAIVVALIVLTGGFIMQANFIVTIIAALAGMIIILTAKHLGSPMEKTSTKS